MPSLSALLFFFPSLSLFSLLFHSLSTVILLSAKFQPKLPCFTPKVAPSLSSNPLYPFFFFSLYHTNSIRSSNFIPPLFCLFCFLLFRSRSNVSPVSRLKGSGHHQSTHPNYTVATCIRPDPPCSQNWAVTAGLIFVLPGFPPHPPQYIQPVSSAPPLLEYTALKKKKFSVPVASFASIPKTASYNAAAGGGRGRYGSSNKSVYP